MVSVPITYFKIVKKNNKEDSKLLTELNKLVKINIKDAETDIKIDDEEKAEKLDKPKRQYLYISQKESEVRNKLDKLGIKKRKPVNYYYGDWKSGVGKKRLNDLEEKLYKLKKDDLKELLNRQNLKGLSSKTKDELIKIILINPSDYI